MFRTSRCRPDRQSTGTDRATFITKVIVWSSVRHTAIRVFQYGSGEAGLETLEHQCRHIETLLRG